MQQQHNTAPHLRVYGNESQQKAAAAQILHVNIIFPTLSSFCGRDRAVYLPTPWAWVWLAVRHFWHCCWCCCWAHTLYCAGRTHDIIRRARKLQIRRCITAAHHWVHLFIKLSSCDSRSARKERGTREARAAAGKFIYAPCCYWRPALCDEHLNFSAAVEIAFLCCAAIFIISRRSAIPIYLSAKKVTLLLDLFLLLRRRAAETRV
jgi:hypothetical protein